MATWRLVGFDTRGNDLELSELQLWSETEQLDATAVMTCSHSPVAGTLADLADGDLQTVCRWSASAVSSPGFYIQWETDGAPSRIKVAAGGDERANLESCYLETLVAGRWVRQRSYEGLQPQGVNEWYASGQLARYVAHVDTVYAETANPICRIPTQVSQGDLILVALLHRRPIAAVPAGWDIAGAALDGTTVGIYQHLTVFSRTATALDAGSSVTVGLTVSDLTNIGSVVIDTGGVAVDITAVTRIDNKNEATGPEYIQVSPALDLQSSDLGFYAIATVYYIGSAGVNDVWTVLPPARGILGTSTRPADNLKPRLAASVIQGLSGSYASAQYQPAASVAPHLFNHVALRIRPRDSRLLTGARAARTERVSVVLAAVGNHVLPQEHLECRTVEAEKVDTEHSGPGTIHGTVEQKLSGDTTLPLKRRVRLHRSRDGLLVRETWSDAQGNYRFDGLSTRYEYDVIAWDHEGQFRSTIANNLKPEVLP